MGGTGIKYAGAIAVALVLFAGLFVQGSAWIGDRVGDYASTWMARYAQTSPIPPVSPLPAITTSAASKRSQIATNKSKPHPTVSADDLARQAQQQAQQKLVVPTTGMNLYDQQDAATHHIIINAINRLSHSLKSQSIGFVLPDGRRGYILTLPTSHTPVSPSRSDRFQLVPPSASMPSDNGPLVQQAGDQELYLCLRTPIAAGREGMVCENLSQHPSFRTADARTSPTRPTDTTTGSSL